MRLDYRKPSTGDIVTLERWFFIVQYDDGTELAQFDETDGSYHSFPEIDQKRVRVFKMANPSTEQVVSLLVPPGAELKHFYRNFVLNYGTPDEEQARWYCFGYESNGVSCNFIITQRDEIIFTDDFEKVAIT